MSQAIFDEAVSMVSRTSLYQYQVDLLTKISKAKGSLIICSTRKMGK